LAAVEGGDRGGQPETRKLARAALDLLGFGARAGSLVTGTHGVRAAAREGGVHLVLLAVDTADGQRGKLVPLLEARRIPYEIVFTRDELGAAIGRPPVSAVGLTHPAMATRVGELLRARLRSAEQQGGS
jgi:ribosomal protein L7Ae-like RNA K-turn-binding protein